MHIDHINIRAPEGELERLRDFYCAMLDLEEGFRPDFGSHGFWLYANDRPLVHLSLGRARRGGAAHGPSHDFGQRPSHGLDHVAFRSAGVDRLRARLEEHGVAHRVTYVPELDLSQVFFADPTGTGLEVNFPGERAR